MRLKFCFFLFLLSSCIQIPVGIEKIQKFEGASYRAPDSNVYRNAGVFSGTGSWLNKKTFSVIGFNSECSESQPSANTYLQSIISAFDKYTVLEESTFPYNSRKALRKKVEIFVEGVPVLSDLVVFNKYGCSFLLSHMNGNGKTGFPEQDALAFENFVKSFKVEK